MSSMKLMGKVNKIKIFLDFLLFVFSFPNTFKWNYLTQSQMEMQ